jgi:hypothetical protein
MTKSHVSLETKVCPVCGVVFETDAILLDTRLKDSLESRTTTGYKLCPKHQEEFEAGYLHLVVAESEDKTSKVIKIEDALYTGEIISIKRDVLSKIINVDLDPKIPFVYIEPEAANIIKEMAGLTEDKA